MTAAAAVLAACAERDIVLFLDAGRLRYSAPPGVLTDADRETIAEHRQEIVAALLADPDPSADPEPTAHCPGCGSPSWWRSPSSPGWRCAYCEPRPEPFTGTSHVVDSGCWRAGTHPPVPEPVTADDVLARHGPVVAGCILDDVLAEADDDDLADFLDDRAALEGFARALLADRRLRPLPDPSLPPLERLASEIGDDVAELRRWLDLSAQGQRIRQRIEREPGACDRCLLALRADPVGGLHAVLLRALDGDPAAPRPPRPADDRVQDEFGAWFTTAQRRALAAYDAHHWRCPTCIRAGRGYGDRCTEGAALHAACRAAVREEPAP